MENRVFLAGQVKEFMEREFVVSTKALEIRVFVSNEIKDYVNRVSQKFDNSEPLYVVVHGLLATLPEYTYIFPYNVVFSKEPQKEGNNVFFSGRVSDVYEYENRYRLFIHSERKGKITKMFATVFKSDFDDFSSYAKSLVGTTILVLGRLSSNKDNENASIIVSEIYYGDFAKGALSIQNDHNFSLEEVSGNEFLDTDELMF